MGVGVESTGWSEAVLLFAATPAWVCCVLGVRMFYMSTMTCLVLKSAARCVGAGRRRWPGRGHGGRGDG